jgi:NAD binding domain of 6-phosphogluconate dehydrogenase
MDFWISPLSVVLLAAGRSLENLLMNIGLIGIGSMGAAMVPNLVKAGHQGCPPHPASTR